MSTVSKEILQERQPFDVAWRTIDGLKIRYATDGKGEEKIVLFSPWPESIFAFVSVWPGLTRQFEVLAIDLPGFGRSEARDDLFAPQTMGEFIAKALDAFGLTSVHAVGPTLDRRRSSLPHSRAQSSFVALSWAPERRHIHSSQRAPSSR